MHSIFHVFLLIFTLSAPLSLHATDYFVLDFEDGKAPPVETGLPIWSLPPAFENNYGPGNFFEVTDETAHSGKYSLRFNYEGRNGYCNTCGLYKTVQKQGVDNADFFVADDAKDLTITTSDKKKKKNKNKNQINKQKKQQKQKKNKNNGGKNKKNHKNKKKNKKKKNKDKGPAAEPGKTVYNRDNGYSKWEITSVDDYNATNDKLSLKLLRTGIDGSLPEFNSEDRVVITRQCGVDGHVGRDIDRRNDCDNVITWFQNVPPQQPGKSIFRRSYLKAEVKDSNLHQKLHFFRPDTKGGLASNIITYADSRRSEELEPLVSGFIKKYGGKAIYRPGFNGMSSGLSFKPGIWYYIEEQYKAATPDLEADADGHIYQANGVYRFWFSPAGEESDKPVLEITGLRMPPLSGGRGKHASFWGNFQHMQDTRGYWYMDDIKISDHKIGKTSGNEKNR